MTKLGSEGFTYIAAMVMVIILGISLGSAGTFWQARMKREREVELLFRGMQYRDALIKWYGRNKVPGQPQDRPLYDLRDLLVDPHSTTKVRYLRRLYLDPTTGKEFAVLRDVNQRIIGVASTSDEEPYKKANFPLELAPEDFEKKTRYSEWQFIYNRPPKK